MNYSMLRYSIFIGLFSIFLCADTLKETVQKDRFLSQGYTGFVKYDNREYLISVGVSPIVDGSVKSKINAIKAAKILAQRGLTKFIHLVKLTSKEELTTVTVTTKEGKKITHQYNENFIEIIREESDGILRNVIEIGKWKKDGEYYFALGVEG